jgi:hypothetical protein
MPEPPSDLYAFDVGISSVELAWSASESAGIEIYRIYRGHASDALELVEQIQTSAAEAIHYVDDPLEPATHYYYAVSAVNSSDEEGALSNVIGTLTLELPEETETGEQGINVNPSSNNSAQISSSSCGQIGGKSSKSTAVLLILLSCSMAALAIRRQSF